MPDTSPVTDIPVTSHSLHPRLAAALAALPAVAHDETAALRLATIRGLLHGYHHRWLAERWEVHEIEREFRAPIVNPRTGRRCRTFEQAGKRDGIVSRLGETLLLEHKTCSEDLDAPWYWTRLTIDTQISSYLLACSVTEQKLDGVLYDVIRKPEIRPKKLTGQERQRFADSGEYCGRTFDATVIDAWRADPECRETHAMFEARLAQDTLTRPDWYFARRIVRRLDSELLTYAEELWLTAEDIRTALRTADRRRNDRACTAYGRPCEYLDLCAGHDIVDSPTWQTLPTLHPELEEPTHGDHLLTHSRLATFATCRRKHWYRYGLGITRGEDAEPLVFGTLLHAALAAWWTTPDADPDGESTDADRGLDAPQVPPGPHPHPCGPGLGEDESRGDGAGPDLPHDEE